MKMIQFFTNVRQFFRNRKYRNAEMVSWWKNADSVLVKVMKSKDGNYVMKMDGEKYLFPGYPRGTLLFGSLSKLKHEIKNQIFNDTWKKLEDGVPEMEILQNIRDDILPKIFSLGKEARYDMVPFEKLNPAVKEVFRAMTKVERGSEKVKILKEILTFILQEDDAYRMRLQWIVKFFPSWYTPTISHFEKALFLLEQAEVVGDMKERIRLFRRIILFVLKDEGIRTRFDQLFKEMDWKKLKLTKADKYFFRGKYFKVDYPEYKY